MFEIGATLRTAREEKSISLVEAEETTKIKRDYLEALETEDYEELPGQVYALGFLKTYARYLGFDTEQITEMCETLKNTLEPTKTVEKVKNDKDKIEPKVRNSRPGRPLFQMPRIRLSLIALIALLIIVSVAFGLWKSQGARDLDLVPGEKVTGEEHPVPIPGDSLNGAENGSLAATPSETKPEGINLELLVRKDKCWMQIVIDGRESFTGTLVAGEQRKFTGQESIYIHLGNAGCVEVFQDGQSLGYLGDWGQVIRKTFTLNEPSNT